MCKIIEAIEIKSESDKKYYEDRLKELIKKELDLEHDIPTPITLAMLVLTLATLTVHTWKATESKGDFFTQVAMAVLGLAGITVIVSVIVQWVKISQGKSDIKNEITIIRKSLECFSSGDTPLSTAHQ